MDQPTHKYLRKFFKRKWLLIIAAFAGLFLGICWEIRMHQPVFIFLGLFSGTALGGGLVLLFGFLDKSFLDPQEAAEFLGVPSLGSISKINTKAR